MSMTPEVYSPTGPLPASSRAVAAFVVGLVSLFCCNLAGPVALFLGMQERRAIRAGLASPVGEGYAVAGLVIGILTTLLLVGGLIMAVLWLFVFGGLAVMGAMANS